MIIISPRMHFSERRSKMENGRWQSCVALSSIFYPQSSPQSEGCLGFAPSSRRLRAGTSLSKFATLVAVCKDRDTKAELNHRGQICEVLIDTGISHRGKRNPKRTESGVRPLLRPCGVSADAPDSLGKWTGMRVARRVSLNTYAR